MEVDINEAGVFVGEFLVMFSTCYHVMVRTAKLLEQAQRAPERDAMRMLTQEVGMCDTYARKVYQLLNSPQPGDTIN